ncbi:MAG: formimidoylglutamate deiminase [Paracoccaceae bacterium]|nr:formimidoylglutamate deiminase [Paracoccaceae bacterium]
MPAIHAARARLPEGWAGDVRVVLDGLRIASVVAGVAAEPGDHRVDVLLPALSNLHSHSFQRAMAGRTEVREAGRESFWTWREVMYRFVERLTPEQVEAVAAMAFCEMQEAGYAAVAEFHYLHHAPGGAAYARPAEMAHRIAAAAAETGIGLCLLPVYYRYGGAGRQALAGGQLRFGCDPARFAALLEDARAGLGALPGDAGLGIAPHSLRAVAPEDLAEVLPMAGAGPVHIHLAEQPREVEEVEAWLGARPVAWLLNNAAVGPGWCAIHATHMTPAEARGLAGRGAVAGLCPITEANLGDGAFGGPGWLAAGGAFGVGSDSNVRIALSEELRMLEYSQRLRDRARGVMVPGAGHVGAFLYLAAAAGGARALGRAAGQIGAGRLADLVALDGGHPALAELDGDALIDGLVFAAGEGVVTDLWSAGRHRVRQGRHLARDGIRTRYRAALRELVAG